VTYIGPVGRQIADERQQAFVDAAHRSGLAYSIVTTGTEMDESSGSSAAAESLATEPAPTAIVCYNDNVAFGVQNALSRSGKTEVAVTGYDNTYIAQLERISLTSIEQNTDEIARRACEVLTDQKAFDSIVGNDILITPELVIRASTSSITIKP
jgi:DNA-binding LacI/PurR family transcriptional regulator